MMERDNFSESGQCRSVLNTLHYHTDRTFGLKRTSCFSGWDLKKYLGKCTIWNFKDRQQ